MDELHEKAIGIAKQFHKSIDTSLALRAKLKKLTDGSREYKNTYYKMLNAETRCMELDEKLYSCVIKLHNYGKAYSAE